MPKASFIKSAMYGHWLTIKLFFVLIESVYIFFLTCIRTLVNTWMFKDYFYLLWWNEINLQSRRKLLENFSPSCPLSYATKLFPKRRLCGKKTPSPNSMLLPTNAQGSGFLLNTQHCFQGKGEREEPVQLRCLEKCCPSVQFSQQFCPRL